MLQTCTVNDHVSNEQNMLEHDIKHKQKTTQKKLHTFKPSHRLTNITLDVLMSYAFHYIIRVLVSKKRNIFFGIINVTYQPSFSVNVEIAFIFNQCNRGSTILDILNELHCIHFASYDTT